MVLFVVGTRPEAVKTAPVLRALKGRLRTVLCSTGQHAELFDMTQDALLLRPDIRLSLMRPGQAPAAFKNRAQAALRPVLRRLAPGLVVVQGDTASAAAGAQAASAEKIPVAHIEAGLRSHDLKNPWPEEGYRLRIDALAALHFAPTELARKNLLAEKIRSSGIFMTGNTVVDELRRRIRLTRPKPLGPLLVTLHRRESFGAPLREMLNGLRDALEKDSDLRLLFPVHPNPKVKSLVDARLCHPRARLLPPLPYPRFLRVLSSCAFVATDSGGLQEEAACLGKPVLVCRDKTDRPESVLSGGAILIGRKRKALRDAVLRLRQDGALFSKMSRAKNPFGDGRSGERIAEQIASFVKSATRSL